MQNVVGMPRGMQYLGINLWRVIKQLNMNLILNFCISIYTCTVQKIIYTLTIHDESMNLFNILHMMQLMQEMKFHITCYVVLCIVISIHIKLRLYR